MTTNIDVFDTFSFNHLRSSGTSTLTNVLLEISSANYIPVQRAVIEINLAGNTYVEVGQTTNNLNAYINGNFSVASFSDDNRSYCNFNVHTYTSTSYEDAQSQIKVNSASFYGANILRRVELFRDTADNENKHIRLYLQLSPGAVQTAPKNRVIIEYTKVMTGIENDNFNFNPIITDHPTSTLGYTLGHGKILNKWTTTSDNEYEPYKIIARIKQVSPGTATIERYFGTFPQSLISLTRNTATLDIVVAAETPASYAKFSGMITDHTETGSLTVWSCYYAQYRAFTVRGTKLDGTNINFTTDDYNFTVAINW